MLFKPAENTQAYMKAGFLGFQGSGKTFTAANLAIGLVKYLREKGLPEGDKPVFFLDTETGSDYVERHFKAADVPLHTAKTRAFSDLLTACREAQDGSSVFMVDSVTHFWRELCDAYAKRKGRTQLQFQDWAYLKSEWAKFSTAYVNNPTHMIICGRAGYEYDFEDNESGGRDLIKTGIKMKTEGEFGFEPSLLVLMERSTDPDTKKVSRVAHVMKERFDIFDGATFQQPTFKNFLPHIEALNLGGKHVGFDASRNSEHSIDIEGKPDWRKRKERKDIALDEIKEVINKHHGGTSQAAKEAKADLLEKHGGTRSWAKIENDFRLEDVEDLRNRLWVELEGHPYNFEPPQSEESKQLANEDVPV